MSTSTLTPKYHWTFAEIKGSITTDTVSQATAQVSNVVMSGQGRIGNAIALNGSDNSFISLGHQIGQFGRADFTVACGVKIAPTTRRIELFGNRISVSHGNFFCVRMTPEGQITAEIDEDNQGTNYIPLSSSAGFDDNVWHHVAVVRQGSTLRLYINGKAVVTGRSNGVANIANGNEFRLGNANPGVDDNAVAPTAAFEDLRIYDHALTDSQIAALVPPLSKGEIELTLVDGTPRILTSDVADLGQLSFEKLRLGSETGITLYQNANFSGTAQDVAADLPKLSETKLGAPPRSIKIWSTPGKPFTGQWAILAPNGQYLSRMAASLTTNPCVTSDFEYFVFRPHPGQQQRLQLIPGDSWSQSRGLGIPIVAGSPQNLFCVDEPGFQQFSLTNEQSDRWLRFIPDQRTLLLPSNGAYFSVDRDTGSVSANNNSPTYGLFEFISRGRNRVAIKTAEQTRYLQIDGGRVDAKATSLDTAETFIVERLDASNKRIFLKTAREGLYLTASSQENKRLKALTTSRQDGELFGRFVLGRFDWTANPAERSIFKRAVKFGDESQVGELSFGEVALYQNRAYWGGVVILNSDCSDLRSVQFDDRTSSIRLGPQTGATLYAQPNYSSTVAAQDRAQEIEDIVENVPNLENSQIRTGNLSSLKIWRNIPPKQANVTYSISLSQDYEQIEGTDELEEFSSYRTILKFQPEVTQVDLWATDYTIIEVNGEFYTVDEEQCLDQEGNSATFVPDSLNRLMITTEAKGINSPGLKIRTNTMQNQERVVIFPDREVHRKIANLENEALWNAKDANNAPLVDRSFSKETVDNVQKTITQTMATVNYLSADSQDENQLVAREITGDAIGNPWSLQFSTPARARAMVAGSGAVAPNLTASPARVVVETTELTQADFDQRLAQASAPLAQGFSSNLRNGLKSLVKQATSVVVGVANGAVHFVIQTAQTVWSGIQEVAGKIKKVAGAIVDWVVSTAEEVGSFVEAVVERIGVAAERFVQYLRAIFDWKDILTTQTVIADALETALSKPRVDALVQSGKAVVSDFMGDLRTTIKASMQSAVNTLKADQSTKQKTAPALPESVEWLLAKLTSSKKSQDNDAPHDPSFPDPAEANPLASTISGFIDQFDSVGKTFTKSLEGFGQTILENLYRPQLVIAGILEQFIKITDAVLAASEKIINGFLETIGQVIELFFQAISTEINIPFFTGLFRKIGAGKLSLLRLTALLVAVPVTVSSKVILGRSPFPATLAQSTREDSIAGWSIVALFSDILNGILSAGLDVVPEGAEPTTLRFKRRVLSGASLEKISAVMSGISWLASFPGSPNFDGGRPYNIADSLYAVSKTNHPTKYWQRVVWGWRTAVLGLDLMFTFIPSAFNISEERLKRGTYASTIFLSLLSIIDIGLTSKYLDTAKPGAASITSELFGVFPSIFGFLRVPPFPPVGLGVLATLDVVSAAVVFGIELADASQENQAAIAP